MTKKTLSCFLCLSLLLTLLPFAAFADGVRFVKVERPNLTDGQYLIVTSDGAGGYVAMGQNCANSTLNALPVTVVDDSITLDDPTGFVYNAAFLDNNETVTLTANDQYLAIYFYNAYVMNLRFQYDTNRIYWKLRDQNEMYIKVETDFLIATESLYYNGEYFKLSETGGSSMEFYKLANGQTLPVVDPVTPKTGDSSTPLLWLGLGLMGAAGAVVLLRKRRAPR